MGAGLSNDALVQPFKTTDALDMAGYAMTYDTSGAGKVKKAGETDVLMGYAFASTKDHITGTATANVMVGVVAPVAGLEISVPVEVDNQIVAYGDPVCITDDATEKGKFDKRDGTNETGTVRGYALEAKAASAGGVLKIRTV